MYQQLSIAVYNSMYQQLSIVPQVWTSYATQGDSTSHSCFTNYNSMYQQLSIAVYNSMYQQLSIVPQVWTS
jgi:hypothetical protein